MSFTYYFAGEHHQDVMEYQASRDCNILRSYVNDQLGISRWIERKKEGRPLLAKMDGCTGYILKVIWQPTI